MAKHKKYYSKKHYSNGYNEEQGKAAFWTAVTIIAIFIFLLVLFWLGVILATAGLLYLVHFLNKTFEWYDTKYWYAPILSYSIAFLLITFGGSQILYNLGTINTTAWNLAVEASDYVSIKGIKGKISIEPNYEGIAEKSIISNASELPVVTNPPQEIQSTPPSQNSGFFGWLIEVASGVGRTVFGSILSPFSSTSK